jgi:uncharacterized protein
MNQIAIINRIRSAREALQAAGVSHAYLFGSVARGEADARSDVDVALDLAEGRKLDIIELCQLQAMISDAAGVEADVTLRAKLKELQGDFNRDAIQIF